MATKTVWYMMLPMGVGFLDKPSVTLRDAGRQIRPSRAATTTVWYMMPLVADLTGDEFALKGLQELNK